MVQQFRNINYQKVARELRDQRVKVEQAIAHHMQLNDELPEVWEEHDLFSENGVREVESNWLEALQLRLRELEWAQNRLDEGTYGFCVDCGKRIASKRLLNDPAVSRCLDCQAAIEKNPHHPTL